MDSETQDLLFMKLDELIRDENAIITWNSAAAALNISPKQAAELLSKYLNDIRQLKPNNLASSYILTGILKNDNKLGVICVKEEELPLKKQEFASIITESIYSIQKTKNINFEALSLVDQEPQNKVLRTGLVIGKNCIKREAKKKIVPTVSSTTVKPTTSFFTKQTTKVETKDIPQKADSVPSKVKEEEKKTVPSTKSKNKGGIANFFSQAPSKPKTTKKVEPVANEQRIEEVDVKLESDSENHPHNKEDNEKRSDEKMEIDEPVERKEEKNNKRRKKKQKNGDVPNKKRKRIQQIEDSDSDIFENDEDIEEDIIDKSYEEPEPPPKPAPITKSKVKKAVDRTYMNDEGYMVTTTEYVFEDGPIDEKEAPLLKKVEKPTVLEKKNSTTDSENDVKTNSSAKGKKNKKAAAKNQPTLMNFFKKT